MQIALPSTTAAVRTTPNPGSAPSARRFGAVLESHRVPTPLPQEQRSPARLALEALDRARADLDAAVAAARTGRTFSPAELLALQSQAYRFGQSVEVASKVVEQAAQAVKQAVNAQV